MPYKDYNNKMAEYMLRRYHQRRAEAIELLGGSCVICGSQDNLEIDHTNAYDKKIALNRMWAIAKERFLKELGKCQLLCKEHHAEKSRVDQRNKALQREAKKRARSSIGRARSF